MKKNYTITDGIAELIINKNIYDKEVLMQTSYVMIEKSYILVDEDEKNYIIMIKPKKKIKDSEVEEMVFEFMDELIESASYIDQLKRTSSIRQIILEKALLSQSTIDEENEK